MIKKTKMEYGDFQTPRGLADTVAAFLRDSGVLPSVIVEPTCGQGSFAVAANNVFHKAHQIFAFDINADYIAALRKQVRDSAKGHWHVAQQDFFTFDWKDFFAPL